MTPDAATVLTGVVEVALDDVSRRGGAAHVAVELESEGDHLVVVVRDDGGAGAAAGEWPGLHPGFDRMSERAATLDGHVGLVSSAGDTVVRIVVPRAMAGR
jgi:signal transduction histidine kinase